MNSEITDEQLMALLDGRVSESDELRIERAISERPEVRIRMERLSGALVWSLGSAPVPKPIVSESLHTAILKLENSWDRIVLVANAPTVPSAGIAIASPPLASPLPGIRLLREIGRGGMGVVYEGIDESLGRRVAVKQLHPERYGDPAARERLNREAQSVAALLHPNILGIYGFQMVGGYPCLIQQFVDGGSLQELLKHEGRLPLDRCVAIATQIARGLAAAHGSGIVHRDLKPDNILIERDTQVVRIADFGLAKRLEQSNLTQEGMVTGTPAYMSPEQAKGGLIDARSDLFSLGAVMYTMSVGEPPFAGDDPFVLLDSIRTRRHKPLSAARADFPGWFAAIVDRLLEKDPNDRFASAAEVVTFLEAQGKPMPQDMRTELHKPHASLIDRPWFWPLTLLLGVVLPILVLGGWWFSQKKRETGNPLMTRQLPEMPTHSSPWNQRTDRHFDSLESAIAEAEDGDTLVLTSDVECDRVDISGKRISIVAAAGTRPTIRSRKKGKDGSSILFRSDTDLTLRGIRIEWHMASTTPIFEDGKVTSLIFSGPGSLLTLDDCEVFRWAGGVCVGAGGNLKMHRTWVDGGDIAVGWYAMENQGEIENCLLHSKMGLAIIYPTATTEVTSNSRLSVSHVSMDVDSVMEILLTRIPNRPCEVSLERCVLDCKVAASITATGMVANEIHVAPRLRTKFLQSVRWSDEHCVYSAGIDFLTGRRLRLLNKRHSAGITTLADWERLGSVGRGDKGKDRSSIETAIETVLPSPGKSSPWLSLDPLHSYSQDLLPTQHFDGKRPGILPNQSIN